MNKSARANLTAETHHGLDVTLNYAQMLNNLNISYSEHLIMDWKQL